MTKGVARYNSGFTPPPRALPSAGIPTFSSTTFVTSGLVCYLDTGDGASWNSNENIWRNLVTSPADASSRSAYDFYLGSSSSSESSDPTFSGVPGGRSANEYFSFDGGDYLTLAGANTAFVNSLHKSGAEFTIVLVMRLGAYGSWGLFGSTAPSGGNYTGIICENNNTTNGSIFFQVYNSGAGVLSGGAASTSSVKLTKGIYSFVAITFKDSTSSLGIYVNGSQETFSKQYSSPATTSAVNTLQLMAFGGNGVPATSGSRLAIFQLYNRALTKTELDQSFAAIRSRFGI